MDELKVIVTKEHAEKAWQEFQENFNICATCLMAQAVIDKLPEVLDVRVGYKSLSFWFNGKDSYYSIDKAGQDLTRAKPHNWIELEFPIEVTLKNANSTK